MSVGRPCITCTHPQRDQIHFQLLRGDKVTDLSKRFGIPSDALFRHLRNHVAASAGDSGLSLTTLLPDLARRVLDIADGAASARASALATGQMSNAVRLGDAELRALVVLTQRLGIEDREVAEQLDGFARFARAVGAMIRDHPEAGVTLAQRLRADGAEELADDVADHVARVGRAKELTTA